MVCHLWKGELWNTILLVYKTILNLFDDSVEVTGAEESETTLISTSYT